MARQLNNITNKKRISKQNQDFNYEIEQYFGLNDQWDDDINPGVNESIDMMRENNFSLKLSNLPNRATREEIKKIINNLNVKSFKIPKSKCKKLTLKHAYVNFWNENDMAFAKGIQLVLRNNKLVWLTSSCKTCHKCGAVDHLVKNCIVSKIPTGNTSKNINEENTNTILIQNLEKEIMTLKETVITLTQTLTLQQEYIKEEFRKSKENAVNVKTRLEKKINDAEIGIVQSIHSNNLTTKKLLESIEEKIMDKLDSSTKSNEKQTHELLTILQGNNYELKDRFLNENENVLVTTSGYPNNTEQEKYIKKSSKGEGSKKKKEKDDEITIKNTKEEKKEERKKQSNLIWLEDFCDSTTNSDSDESNGSTDRDEAIIDYLNDNGVWATMKLMASLDIDISDLGMEAKDIFLKRLENYEKERYLYHNGKFND